MISAEKAKQTRIFVIEGFEEVKETNLYDFVMESAEETTSFRGVERVLQITPLEYDCPNPECNNSCEGCNGLGFVIKYEVSTWVSRQSQISLEVFDTREEAENYVFERTLKFDFANDCSRRTDYYDTREEAEAEMVKSYAEVYQISLSTAQSIFRHKNCKEKIKVFKNEEKAFEIERERDRLIKIAKEYAKLLKPQRETYDQTCSRLSKVIKGKIENRVFHIAVKIIRSRFVNI